ncbi:Zip-domain-containing protein [Aureobasidium pullulans]|uniref:Zip-domain-containing protein n=1 Tax=Aureobasidium pullulans TaxID=5580 RepID=A0A4S9PKD5_AURPU|nr:Zip-domain-containing protein [Aureobasidium pullulans]THY70607.1 Zip-domain-containing protein [Aureobasidium pullulans]THZ40517.1 Zip-domain-containing protein [Aureobasidium pullulans]THZ58215.1 Zip-domain-containing protein [Aureobasidium pullulans]THZ94375.1 Zip-domain-containing protein [Aureobasidium pullulans]
MAIMSRVYAILLVVLVALCQIIAAQSEKIPVGDLSSAEIEEQIQQCPLVQTLNAHKASTAHEAATGFTARAFAVLFPGSPAINTLLSVLYISGPPNFLLALCPSDIDPASLNTMVAFAFGGLMGDTLFHLLPEIFVGEDSPEHVTLVVADGNKNILLGIAIMVGFVSFVILDKAIRIASGGDEGHGHSHGHAHGKIEGGENAAASAKASGSEKAQTEGLRQRNGEKASVVPVEQQQESGPNSNRGYLNIIADFTHNITDGLAMASSFYASPTVGALTTTAVFFHEVPHEVGDFALLIQSGFSKRAAIGAQFLTAAGALTGALMGIAVQEYGGNAADAMSTPGLFGTSLHWGDLLLPWTAGTFMFVGMSVVPELMETGPNKVAEVKKIVTQLVAIAAGAGIMIA